MLRAAELGIKKIRLTGGEPLVRRDITGLCRQLSELNGLEELTMTTNGTLLAPAARDLKDAGGSRVNISPDTLDGEKYRHITRLGELSDALAGIKAAVDTGFNAVKISCVLIGGFNDDEIPALASLSTEYPVDVRFIELMPIGNTGVFSNEAYIPASVVPDRLPGLESCGIRYGVAEMYRFPGAPGRVGLIRPLSACFCPECNRIRLTADGCIKPCLNSRDEIPLRGLHGDALKAGLAKAIYGKPARHEGLSADKPSLAQRDMNAIGG